MNIDSAGLPLPLGERAAAHDRTRAEQGAAQLDEVTIRRIVEAFYDKARRDLLLGPVFDQHVHDWPRHFDRMQDFWSAAMLRTGRYSGRPIEAHRRVRAIRTAHFDRWLELFDETVRDHCVEHDAQSFVRMAERMKQSMVLCLSLSDEPDNEH